MSPPVRFSDVPWTLPVCGLSLMLLGLTAIERVAALGGPAAAEKQVVWIGLTLLAMTVTALVPPRFLNAFAPVFYLGSVAALIAVFFTPAINGSRRWISIAGFTVQPSEAMKLAFILLLAVQFRWRSTHRRLPGLLGPIGLTLLPVALILREPDLGTSLLFVPIAGAMLIAAGIRLRHLLLFVFAGLAAVPPLWMLMSSEQKSRVVVVFARPDERSIRSDGYHLWRSRQVLRRGGWKGSFLADRSDLSAREKPLHLPAAETDFIFCVIVERFGLWGAIGVLLLEFLVVGGCFRVARRTRDPSDRLVPVGIGALIASQTVINTAMTVGLLPITGMTLPLVSYGGSSLVCTGVGLGLVIGIAIHPRNVLGDDPFAYSSESGAWG